MRQITLTLAAPAIALTLAACSSMPSNNQPVVKVVKGAVAVSPDPIRIMAGDIAPITWQIDPSSPDVRFADNGIAMAGELPLEYIGENLNMPGKPQNEVVNCRRLADGRQFQCDNKNTRQGVYKYVINVTTADGKPLPPYVSLVVNTDRQ